MQAIHSFASDSKTDIDTRNSHEQDSETKVVDELISNLSVTPDINSIPRKCPVFERYCQRNRRRLLPSYPELDKFIPDEQTTQEPPAKRQKKSYNIPTKLKNIAQIAFSLIQRRQRPLMNLPTPTDDEDSAIGQLHLLGFGDYAHNNHNPVETVEDVKKRISEKESGDGGTKEFKLHVVHRLDCQVCTLISTCCNGDQLCCANTLFYIRLLGLW